MKNLTFAFALMLWSALSLQASTEKTVKSTIDKATVYQTGGLLSRVAKVKLDAGQSDIVFSGLSAFAQSSNIQASGSGDFTIMDVKYRRVPVPAEKAIPVKYNPQLLIDIERLTDSLAMIELDIKAIQADKVSVGEARKYLLKKIELLDTIVHLESTLGLLREQLAAMNEKMIVLQKKEYSTKKHKIDLVNLQKKYMFKKHKIEREWPKPKPAYTDYQVVVTLSANAKVEATIRIKYQVQNAGWIPAYDVRASGEDESVNLVYKAQIYQNTGIDWDNVQLTMSTANPTQSQQKPELPVWYLDYFDYVQYKRSQGQFNYSSNRMKAAKPMMQGAGASKELQDMKQAKTENKADYATSFTTISSSLINVQYTIDLPYSIPSDNMKHTVQMKTTKIGVDYAYFAVPSMDKSTFLMAKISGWDSLNLMPATANLFLDGTYIGQSYIDPRDVKDTMYLSLGRDHSIVVTRVKLVSENKSKESGNKKIKSFHYLITIRNTKQKDIDLTIEDRIPVSARKEDIEVKLLEASDGIVKEETGHVSWQYDLTPGEIKTLKLAYQVKWPKDKQINNLQ